MVEYLETVLESGGDSTGNNKVMERTEEEIPVPNSADRKKHLSQDSAGRTRHSLYTQPSMLERFSEASNQLYQCRPLKKVLSVNIYSKYNLLFLRASTHYALFGRSLVFSCFCKL
jgi:hypothetical protein